MRKRILLAVLMAVCFAVPAFASVQNIKVSGGINSTWLYRENFDLGNNPSDNEIQNLMITQTHVRVDADLTDNVSTTVQLLNERAWTDVGATPADNDIDIDLAYVTLREMLYSPLTVIIGRQAFHYGNSFIVDSGGTNNNITGGGLNGVAEDLTWTTQQDAIRLIFDYNPLKIELLAAKIDANTLTAAEADDANNDDVDLYGANASYNLGDSMNTQVEAYFFAKLDKSVAGGTSTRSSEADSVYVPGLRASTNPIEGLNLQAEIAIQRGNKVASTGTRLGNQNREAVGGEIIANYQIPVLKEYKPTAQYVFSYTSGDQNATTHTSVSGHPLDKSGETWTAWDPMFENQAGGKIYNSLFDLTNSQIHMVTLSANPIEDVTTSFSWTGIWMDKALDSTTALTMRQPDGTTVTPTLALNEKFVGNEFDAGLAYNYTEDVSIGANVGWFMPGDDLFAYRGNGATNSRSTAFQSLVNVNVNF